MSLPAGATLQYIVPSDQWIFDDDGNLIGIKNPRANGDDLLITGISVDAGDLTGTTLAANVVNASLNSITPSGGTLAVTGNQQNTGIMSITANSASPGLTATQNGAGPAIVAGGGNVEIRDTYSLKLGYSGLQATITGSDALTLTPRSGYGVLLNSDVDINGVLGMPEVTAPTGGQGKIYFDAADGDLKVRFANGTVKTIETNT